MDTVLKKVKRLAAIAGERPEPPFSHDNVVQAIDSLVPDAPPTEAPIRFLFDMAVAGGAAAAVAVVAAVSAWVDLHDPFLALDTLGNVLEHL